MGNIPSTQRKPTQIHQNKYCLGIEAKVHDIELYVIDEALAALQELSVV
jgi:hypothetical protein